MNKSLITLVLLVMLAGKEYWSLNLPKIVPSPSVIDRVSSARANEVNLRDTISPSSVSIVWVSLRLLGYPPGWLGEVTMPPKEKWSGVKILKISTQSML